MGLSEDESQSTLHGDHWWRVGGSIYVYLTCMSRTLPYDMNAHSPISLYINTLVAYPGDIVMRYYCGHESLARIGVDGFLASPTTRTGRAIFVGLPIYIHRRTEFLK